MYFNHNSNNIGFLGTVLVGFCNHVIELAAARLNTLGQKKCLRSMLVFVKAKCERTLLNANPLYILTFNSFQMYVISNSL